MLCMQRATAALLYIYVGLIVLLACIQAVGERPFSLTLHLLP